MLRGRPPASPEPTQPGRRADERGEPLSCSPPLDHRIASPPAPGAHEREQADTRQLGDQPPRRLCRPTTQLHTPRDNACRRSAQMVLRLTVVPAVAVAVVLVCEPMSAPGSAGAITAQPDPTLHGGVAARFGPPYQSSNSAQGHHAARQPARCTEAGSSHQTPQGRQSRPTAQLHGPRGR